MDKKKHPIFTEADASKKYVHRRPPPNTNPPTSRPRPKPTSSTEIPQGEYVWDSVSGWIFKKLGG